MNFQTESVSDVALKASLPAGVTGMNLFGIGLPDWVQILTVIYVFLLAVDKLYIMFLRYRERNNKAAIEKLDESKE